MYFNNDFTLEDVTKREHSVLLSYIVTQREKNVTLRVLLIGTFFPKG